MVQSDFQGNGQAAAAYYREHILAVITDHRGMEKALTKNAYAPAMEAYADACRETFEQLNIACTTGALTLQEAADWFWDRLDEQWEQEKGPLKSRSSIMNGDKFLIAVFLVPMIRRLELPSMEDFCVALHQSWMNRYPKSPWQIGDFDTINASFQKKLLGFCFITTAVCVTLGKEDDCAELTAFRSFRDGYLRTCPDGPALIEEYYRIAPAIILEIEKTADAERRYAAIWNEHLSFCYADLQAGRLQQCKQRYTQMVRSLEKEYLG